MRSNAIERSIILQLHWGTCLILKPGSQRCAKLAVPNGCWPTRTYMLFGICGASTLDASIASLSAKSPKKAKQHALKPKTTLSLSCWPFKSEAAPTAESVRRKKATTEPKNTGIKGWEACCPIIAICVRSPHSAMKTPMKDFPRTLQLTTPTEDSWFLLGLASPVYMETSVTSISAHSSLPASMMSLSGSASYQSFAYIRAKQKNKPAVKKPRTTLDKTCAKARPRAAAKKQCRKRAVKDPRKTVKGPYRSAKMRPMNQVLSKSSAMPTSATDLPMTSKLVLLETARTE
mmetsp:Transcript_124789/g.399866  ORF Transcript_124789/g.399866 Transcript_124789/m.399866 type:complete len:289 (-) Transcript_124789:85-951(-)